MKFEFKKLLPTLLLMVLSAPNLHAQSRKEKIANSSLASDKETGIRSRQDWSAGVILGSPTGFVAKNEFLSDQAVDFGLSYSLDKMFIFYADWHYRAPALFRKMNIQGDLARIEGYIGIGAGVLLSGDGNDNPLKREDNDASFGMLLRIPLGLQYRMQTAPFAFFLELVPGIGILPGTFGYFGGGIGARYYF